MRGCMYIYKRVCVNDMMVGDWDPLAYTNLFIIILYDTSWSHLVSLDK